MQAFRELLREARSVLAGILAKLDEVPFEG
jgi:hypothetical protein